MRASHLLNGLVAALVIAVALFSGPADGRAFELVRASGAVSLSNSREGAAILGGSDLRPEPTLERHGDDRQPRLDGHRAGARGRARERDRRQRRRSPLGPHCGS